MAEATCEQCGTQFRPHRPGREQRFCTNSCRFEWMRLTGRQHRGTKTCPACGQSFVPRGQQVACSNPCRHKMSRNSVTKRCEQCGGTFTKPASVASMVTFCSWACRTAQPRNYRLDAVPISYVDCGCCGKTFCHPTSDGTRVYCSRQCMVVGRAATRRKQFPARVIKSCESCGKSLSFPPSQLGRKKFCSRRCAGLGRPMAQVSRISIDAIDVWSTMTSEVWVQEYRLGWYAIDLALPLRRIAVELDGEYWHSLPNVKANDQRKASYLASQGWRLERVPILKGDTPAAVAAKIDKALRKVRADERRQRRNGAA